MQFLCVFLWEKTNPLSTPHVFVQVLLLEQMQCLLRFCSGKILYVGTTLPSPPPFTSQILYVGSTEDDQTAHRALANASFKHSSV